MAVKFNQDLFNGGQRIREIRVRKGISQTELALTMGTTKTAVSYWENGQRALRIDNFLKLARALDVHPSKLLMGHEEMSLEEETQVQSLSVLPRNQKQLILQTVRMMVTGAEHETGA